MDTEVSRGAGPGPGELLRPSARPSACDPNISADADQFPSQGYTRTLAPSATSTLKMLTPPPPRQPLTQDLLHTTSFLFHPHLEPPGQELIFHLQEVPLIGFRLKRLIDNGKLSIVLDVLPPGIAMTARGGKGTIKETDWT